MAGRKKSSKGSALKSHVRVLVAVLLTLVGYLAFRDPIGRELIDSGIARYTGSDEQVLFGGMPISQERLRIVRNDGFIVGYDELRRNPRWVAYRLEPTNADTPPRSDNFRVDRRTRARVEEAEFTNSGYDRGHMAPSAAIGRSLGPASQEQTFFMSNICPQQPALNRNAWRRLEAMIGQEYTHRYGDLWVITGPVFDEHRTTLESGVEVPDAFYKVILRVDRGQPTALAFMVSQYVSGDEPIDSFLTSVDHIEQLTGLDFFPMLDDSIEVAVEARVPSELWHQTIIAQFQDQGLVPAPGVNDPLVAPAAFSR